MLPRHEVSFTVIRLGEVGASAPADASAMHQQSSVISMTPAISCLLSFGMLMPGPDLPTAAPAAAELVSASQATISGGDFSGHRARLILARSATGGVAARRRGEPFRAAGPQPLRLYSPFAKPRRALLNHFSGGFTPWSDEPHARSLEGRRGRRHKNTKSAEAP